MDPSPLFHNISLSIYLLLRNFSEVKIFANICSVGQDAIGVPPHCSRVISDIQLHQQARTGGSGVALALTFTNSAVKSKLNGVILSPKARILSFFFCRSL